MLQAFRGEQFIVKDNVAATVKDFGAVQAWSTEDDMRYVFGAWLIATDNSGRWWVLLFDDSYSGNAPHTTMMYGEEEPTYSVLDALAAPCARNLYFERYGIPANRTQ